MPKTKNTKNSLRSLASNDSPVLKAITPAVLPVDLATDGWANNKNAVNTSVKKLITLLDAANVTQNAFNLESSTTLDELNDTVDEIFDKAGMAEGFAILDANGLISLANLPSDIVNQIIPVANFAALPATGEEDKLYVTEDLNELYRWTGTAYVKTGGSSTGVNSFNNRQGDIAPNVGDYNTDLVTQLENAVNRYYVASIAKTDLILQSIPETSTPQQDAQAPSYGALKTIVSQSIDEEHLAQLASVYAVKNAIDPLSGNFLSFGIGTNYTMQTGVRNVLINNTSATPITINLPTESTPLADRTSIKYTIHIHPSSVSDVLIQAPINVTINGSSTPLRYSANDVITAIYEADNVGNWLVKEE